MKTPAQAFALTGQSERIQPGQSAFCPQINFFFGALTFFSLRKRKGAANKIDATGSGIPLYEQLVGESLAIGEVDKIVNISLTTAASRKKINGCCALMARICSADMWGR